MRRLPPAVKAGSTHATTAQQLIDWYKQGRTWYRDRTRWSVSISSDDRLYDVAHRWFTQIPNVTPPRALSARISYGNKEASSPASEVSETRVNLYYDVRQDREVDFDGHQVTVSLNKAETPTTKDGDLSSYVRMFQPDVLSFHARSCEGQQAVVAMLRDLTASQDKRKPALYLLNNWGGWTRRDDLPQRSIDSVVLATGQMETIAADIQRFLDAESGYVRRGIPYHRGYLFHGTAGTGKTSTVRALASHFGLDLWYAPLGDLAKDTSLLRLISEVGPRSILLLEDIDVFHAATQRNDSSDGVSMAGLLNALDGAATPHGMMTVLTTNDIDMIDKALLRPGRVDLKVEMGLPDREHVIRLWRQFYSVTDAIDPASITQVRSTAELMELFKQHMDDPAGALRNLQGGR